MGFFLHSKWHHRGTNDVVHPSHLYCGIEATIDMIYLDNSSHSLMNLNQDKCYGSWLLDHQHRSCGNTYGIDNTKDKFQLPWNDTLIPFTKTIVGLL